MGTATVATTLGTTLGTAVVQQKQGSPVKISIQEGKPIQSLGGVQLFATHLQKSDTPIQKIIPT